MICSCHIRQVVIYINVLYIVQLNIMNIDFVNYFQQRIDVNICKGHVEWHT